MHGRGSYATPVGQGSYASIPSFHQRAHAPPPPPPSQMSQPPRMTAVQSGPLPLPSRVGQMGHHVFQNVPPGPPQHMPFPAVPSSGINAQPYFAPPPLPPPSTIPPQLLPRSYGSSGLQQHPQWRQTPHFMSPAAPSLTMLQQPSPLLGQTLYRGQLSQQTVSSSDFHVSFHAGSILPTGPQPPNMPAIRLPPPPPPPPPPPLPSSRPGSPPLPPSPFAVSREIGSSASPHAKLGEIPSDSVGAVLASSSTADHVSKNGGSLTCQGETGSKIVSKNVKSVTLDLSPPPPSPTDARMLHNIEFVCNSIAEKGLQYEDMIRQREFGNPEFSFLFGDERGSGNSIAHEYFLWMKKKLQLVDGEPKKSDSLEREKETSASQSKRCIPNSPVDSDMDMEDDITHPDGAVTSSFTQRRHDIVAASNEVDTNDLHLSNSSEEHILDKRVLDKKFPSSESSGLGERQGPDTSSNPDHVVLQISFAKADESVRNSLAEVRSPLDSNICDLSSPHTDFIPQSETALEDSSSEKLTGQLVKEVSPFRLLQDYASDGSSDYEALCGDIFAVTVTQNIDKGSPTLDAGVTDAGSKGFLKSNKSLEGPEESCINQRIITSDIDNSSFSKKNEDLVQKVNSNQDSVIHGSCQGGLEEDNIQRESRSPFDIKEDSKSTAGLPKIDEFGRLVREGGSESDYEGSPRYTRRRGKRDRSRSRSRSPHDRRRRRSPWRRKTRRDRSRSLSPKRRRSRSRSPPHWLGGDKIRREKGVAAACFDFLRGKCYRGASCRYMHHEDKIERSRSYRSKMQRQDLSFSSRTSDFSEKIETSEKKFHHDDEVGFKELNTPKDRLYSKENRVLEEPDRCLPKEGDHSEQGVFPTPETDKEKLQTIAACSTSSIKNEPEQPDEQICTPIVQSVNVHYAEMHSAASQSLTNFSSISDLTQNPIDKPPNLDSSDNPESGFSSLNKPVSSETLSQSVVSMEPVPPMSASDLSHEQPPSFSSVVQETHASYTKQSPRDSNLVLPLPNYPSNGLSMYQASVSYGHAQYPPPIPFWTSLPPPPPHFPAPSPMLGINTTASLVHGQYGSHVPVQGLAQPPRMDFSTHNTLRPYTTDSSSTGLHQVYPSKQELNEDSRPWDGLQSKTIHGNQAMSHPRAGDEMVGGQCFSGRALPDLYPSSSISQENLVFKGVKSSEEPLSSEVHAHPDERAAPADGVPSLFGEDGKVSTSLSRYTSDLLNRNQASRFSDFGASRVVSHFNPYASTFDRPLNSNFSSNLSTHEMDRQHGSRFGTSFGLNQPAVNGGGVASVSSNNFFSPQNSAQAVQGILPTPSGDQYDPLNDSLEPFSNSVMKSDHGQRHENNGESESRFRFSGLNKPLDLDENSNKAGSGAVPVSESLENEEYGETADAEVGDVENESSSNLNDAADDAVAEDAEVDQVKAPGKKKKSKESRSMRQFKVALAGFVKEVLKPSWRQGNMSKEAFKTIVKKTVDKVAGAMKSGHIPKSQEKINRFIDSSQRKLTKLVMGYVDKYVKV